MGTKKLTTYLNPTRMDACQRVGGLPREESQPLRDGKAGTRREGMALNQFTLANLLGWILTNSLRELSKKGLISSGTTRTTSIFGKHVAYLL